MTKTSVPKHTISQSQLKFAEQNKFFDIIKTKVGPDDISIISISGGPDSMLTAVLMYNFYKANKYNLQNLIFVHFNHKLRKESDQEEIFLQNYFKGTNLICITRLPLSITHSTEASLRNRRYSELQKIVNKYKAQYVFFGHNLSDRIESSFMNLLRGASLKGFISMNEVQDHNLLKGVEVIRPLLSLGKNYITTICKQNNIPYVVDQSNFDSSVSLRNKLRNQVLPSIYSLSNRTTENSVASSGQSTFESSMLKLYESIEKLNSDNCPPLLRGGSGGVEPILTSSHRKSKFAYQRNIPIKEINSDNIADLLHKLGIYKNISSSLINELLKFFHNSKDGHKYFNKTYFFIAHNKIYIISAAENFWKKTVNKKVLMGNKATIFGDFTIRPEPILEGCTIRYPKAGDKFHNKTFSHYCINQKIPIFWRNYLPVLEKQNKIIKIIKPIT